MRGGGDAPERPSVLVWLMIAVGGSFVLQLILMSRLVGAGRLVEPLLLSVPNLQSWKLWTLFTYGFLHDPNNLLHVVFNLLGLYFLGREVLPRLGSRSFLTVYFLSVLCGGMLWSVIHWTSGGSALLGASAGVLGLLAVFAAMFPNQPMTFLLFFVFPVTIKPKYLALGVAAFELIGMIFYEMGRGPSMIAHSAHIGGMAAGWVYYRYFHNPDWTFRMPGRERSTSRWKRAARATIAAPLQAIGNSVANRPDLRSEVDRILDKINSQGFASLSAEEKKLLDQAKDMLSRR